MKRKAKSNLVNPEFIINSEYFIFAIISCLDTIGHIINKIYCLGLKENLTTFEKVFHKLKHKRDNFSRLFLKERREWINELREIRNRMTHHQIISFASKLSEQLQTKKITYTKHCISVVNEKGDEIQKPLPNYFEDIVRNYNRFRNEFYKKLNSII